MMTRDWIVISGQPVDSTTGGGYEFFGPFTQEEAERLRESWVKDKDDPFSHIVMAVQLLRATPPPRASRSA